MRAWQLRLGNVYLNNCLFENDHNGGCSHEIKSSKRASAERRQ